MRARSAFEYAIVRVVPHVEREEFVNAGVILYCEDRALLIARIELDEARLLAIAPDVDLELVTSHLDAIARVCEGRASSGPIGHLPIRERWRYLVAPKSTILQTSPPHAGMSDAPEEVLERLIARVVRSPRASTQSPPPTEPS